MSKSDVYNEDCLKTLKRMESGSINLLLQDPPFGVTQNKWDIKPDLKTMWPEWLRVAKDNAAIIFFATQPFASELILSQPKYFRYDLIWYKPLPGGFLNANKMPLRTHENILVFYKKLPTYNPQKTRALQLRTRLTPNDRTKTNYGKLKEGKNNYDNKGLSFPISIIEGVNGGDERLTSHPTQKPLSIIRYLIATYSNPADLVFDGYLGRGTTAIAAYMEGRDFIGSEINEEYFTASQKLFKEQTAQIKLL